MLRAVATAALSLGFALGGCSLFVDLGGISDEPALAPGADTGTTDGGGGGADGPSDDSSRVDAADDAGALRVLRRMTFEQGKLVDPTTGADEVVGTMTLESASPVAGAFSARVTNAADRGYLRASFAATDEVAVVLTIRIEALPSQKLRILRIGDEGTTPTAELGLEPSGALDIDGAESTALAIDQSYRIEVRVRRGQSGSIEAKVAPSANPFGAPFVSTTRAILENMDRVFVGQTIPSGYGIDLVVDDIEIAVR